MQVDMRRITFYAADLVSVLSSSSTMKSTCHKNGESDGIVRWLTSSSSIVQALR